MLAGVTIAVRVGGSGSAALQQPVDEGEDENEAEDAAGEELGADAGYDCFA